MIRHIASRINACYVGSLENVCFDVACIVNLDASISGDMTVR
jgi:hypothetical protein